MKQWLESLYIEKFTNISVEKLVDLQFADVRQPSRLRARISPRNFASKDRRSRTNFKVLKEAHVICFLLTKRKTSDSPK